MSIRAVIHGRGHSVPDKVLTNADFERMVDTDSEWIVQRTGIEERRVCTAEESTSTLAIAAGKEALDSAGVRAADIDLVVVSTVTGDMQFPSTASMVQDAVGAKNAGAFDIGAACAGFIYSLSVSASIVESGRAKTVLLIGADALTKFVDYTDRTTCILFGDGAGAFVLKGEEGTDRGLIDTVMYSDGSGLVYINVEGGGSRYPHDLASSHGKKPYIYMAGPETYKFAVKAMVDACGKVLEKTGMTASDVDLFVPHQANLRIIMSAASRLGLSDEKVYLNVQKYGNTSGGSIPLGLYEAVIDGRLEKNMVVMTVGFGAGLVWGANLIRW